MDSSQGIDWDFVRDTQFPVVRNWAYFDHAAVAPLPRRSGEVLREWALNQEQNGVVGWLEQERRLEATRDRVASLINADRDEIAFINSTTQGIGLIAEGYPWRPGDNVVTAADEYPSNLLPWMNLASRGVERPAGAQPRGPDLARGPGRGVRSLDTGPGHQPRRVRHRVPQRPGCTGRDLPGTRGRAVRQRHPGARTLSNRRATDADRLPGRRRPQVAPRAGGRGISIREAGMDRPAPADRRRAHSVIGSYNAPRVELQLKPNAQRWEGGSFSMPGLLTFGASVELFHEWGLDAVSRRIVDRAEAVRELAASAGWTVYGSPREADRSAIVVLERDGVDPAAAAIELRRTRGLVVACRRGRLRISPHVYNNHEDLERLRAGLEAIH